MGSKSSSGATEATTAASAAGYGLPAFASNEWVLHLQNPKIGSDIWLVGVVHGKVASVEVREM